KAAAVNLNGGHSIAATLTRALVLLDAEPALLGVRRDCPSVPVAHPTPRLRSRFARSVCKAPSAKPECRARSTPAVGVRFQARVFIYVGVRFKAGCPGAAEADRGPRH